MKDLRVRWGDGGKRRKRVLAARQGWTYKRAVIAGGRWGQEELPEPVWTAPMYMIWTGWAQPLELLGR